MGIKHWLSQTGGENGPARGMNGISATRTAMTVDTGRNGSSSSGLGHRPLDFQRRSEVSISRWLLNARLDECFRQPVSRGLPAFGMSGHPRRIGDFGTGASPAANLRVVGYAIILVVHIDLVAKLTNRMIPSSCISTCRRSALYFGELGVFYFLSSAQRLWPW